MRPPTWLYLPHLGCGGGIDMTERSDGADGDGHRGQPRDVHAGGGAASDGAVAAAIRGHGTVPGPRRGLGTDATAAIRGRDAASGAARRGGGDTTSPKTSTSGAGRAISAAMERYFANLDLERAAKRSRAEDSRGSAGELTAAQRLAALRRRVARRAEAGVSANVGAGAVDADARIDDRGESADGADQAEVHVEGSRHFLTNEVIKMHQSASHELTTSCYTGAAPLTGATLGQEAGESSGASTSAAAVAAAATWAWHARGGDQHRAGGGHMSDR